MKALCDECGKEYGIGDYPFCPHGKPLGMGPEFRAYLDEENFPKPVEVTSLAQKRRLERIYGLVEREPPRPGDISRRKDWAHEVRKQEALCR